MANELDLPSDNGSDWLPSDDDQLMAGSDDTDPGPAVSWNCACAQACVAPGTDLEMQCKLMRENVKACDRESHRQKAWLMLRDLRVSQGLKTGYQIAGFPVCRQIFCKAVSIGKKTLADLVSSVDGNGPPADGGTAPAKKMQYSRVNSDCSKFFWHAWTHYAMHLPVNPDEKDQTQPDFQFVQDPEVQPLQLESCALQEPGLQEAECQQDLLDQQRSLQLDEMSANEPGADYLSQVTERRYLPHMTFQEFYELYGEWSEKPVHLSSFRRTYFNGGWRDYLRIASTVQHGKCSTCERLKDLKKKASTHAQISQVQQAHSKHVQAVLADRNCDSRAEQLGVDSVTPLAKGVEWQAKIPREKGCLNWTQDHMDQSKFRVPRNTSMSKTLVDSWRPQVGAAGIILDGLGKFLFLTDQDLGKDANIQCSVTGRALQVWCFAKWCGKHFCSFSIFQ